MNDNSILANMAKGWNRSPDHSAEAGNPAGLSAAFWTNRIDATLDVTADPLDGHHIICLQMAPLIADFWHDEILNYSGGYRPGDVSIVPTGRRPRALMHGKFACLHLYVSNQLLKETAEAEDLAASRSFDIIDPKRIADPLIHRIGRDILDEMQGQLPLSRLRVDTLGMDLAIQLLRNYSGEGSRWARPVGRYKGGLTPWQLRRCVEMLASDLAGEHSQRVLAAEIGLSPFHFARAFKQSTGVPPHTYLMHLRLEHARILLATTDKSITDIAFEIGYQSTQAFSRVFRKAYACSPTDFRRERAF